MRLLLPALLLAAVAVCSSALTVAELRPCNVSLFAESFVVVLGKYGITWVDGYQRSLEEMNKRLDDRLQDVANQKYHHYALRWNSAKLFYSANYSHVIVTGFNFNWKDEKFRRFQIGILDARDLNESKYNGHRGWEVIPDRSHDYRFCVANVVRTNMQLIGIVEGDDTDGVDSQKICDSNSVTFIPNEHRFVFDGNKNMSFEIFGEHPSYKSPELKYIPKKCGKDGFRTFYVDDFYPRMCKDNMPEGVPNEMVPDFNDNVENKFGNLFDESKKENWTTDAFFYNQLESGKFKLQAELVNVNGTEFYYHILTRLDRYELIDEVEKCYIRKFQKEEVKDKFKRDDQPLEFPRMLIIPKESGPNGVVMPLIAKPTTTTTTTSTTTTTTNISTVDPTNQTAAESNQTDDAPDDPSQSRGEGSNNDDSETTLNLSAKTFISSSVFGILFLVTFS